MCFLWKKCLLGMQESITWLHINRQKQNALNASNYSNGNQKGKHSLEWQRRWQVTPIGNQSHYSRVFYMWPKEKWSSLYCSILNTNQTLHWCDTIVSKTETVSIVGVTLHGTNILKIDNSHTQCDITTYSHTQCDYSTPEKPSQKRTKRFLHMYVTLLFGKDDFRCLSLMILWFTDQLQDWY